MGTLTLYGLRRGDCRELFNEEGESLRVACGLQREAKQKRKAEEKPERKLEVKPKRKKKE